MPFEYRAKFISAHDGDSVTLRIDLGFSLFLEKSVRLNGIDTPELKGFTKQPALAAKVWLEKKIAGKNLIVQTCLVRDDGGLDKYGRVLGTIFVEGETTSVNDQIIAAGHAIPYDGGNKEKAQERAATPVISLPEPATPTTPTTARSRKPS